MPYADPEKRREYVRSYKAEHRPIDLAAQAAQREEAKQNGTPINGVRFCQVCESLTPAVTKVPGGALEYVCHEHAIDFWQGLVSAASAIRQIDRQVTAELDAEFHEQQARHHDAIAGAQAALHHAFAVDAETRALTDDGIPGTGLEVGNP